MYRQIKRIFLPKIRLSKQMPKHVVINPFHRKKTEMPEFVSILKKIEGIMRLQVKLGIPVVTVNLLSKNFSPEHVDVLVDYFYRMGKAQIIQDNKIRVSVLGKWYDLPGRAVEPIKEIVDDTRDYDSFFLNFCVDYDPHEEITDACRIITRKIEAKKLSLEDIDNQEFKENLSSSYFVPADLVIEAGSRFSGTLLWDSVDAKIIFTGGKHFETRDFLKGIREWQRG